MRIRKTSQTTPIQAQVVNTKSNSTTDSYSCDYVNNALLDNYSNTERVVGTWFGKPLYQKTIYISSLPNNAVGTYNPGISNVDFIFIDIGNSLFIPSGGFQSYTLNNIREDNLGFQVRTLLQYYNNVASLLIVTKSNYSGASAYVTLKYTKTTD